MNERKKITPEEIQARYEEAPPWSLPLEAWQAYCEYNAYDDPQVEDAAECYAGEFHSVRDFAENFADEIGLLDKMPDNLWAYFDYEAYGRDLMMGGDVWQENGFWFWSR